MIETGYYLDLYRQRVKRVRYLILLLLTIFSLMLVDFFLVQWRFEDYYSKLPLLLHDFSQKYDKPLAVWWRGYKEGSASRTLRSFDARAIPFQNRDASDTDKGVYWERIPILHEYLVPHRPSTSDARKFLGWELPLPLYFVVALYIPSALLLWILIDMRFLRQASAILYQGTSSETSRLAVQSVLYDRIGAENHSLRWLRAAVVAVSLFALASASGALVISPSIHAVRIVEGTLYLTPQFAKVSIAEVPDWHPSNLWVARWLVLVAVDTILCALIGRELTKIKT